MPYLRHSSPADNPAACSFRTLMICSSVNLLLRMSVSRRNGLYPNSGAFMGSRSDRMNVLRETAIIHLFEVLKFLIAGLLLLNRSLKIWRVLVASASLNVCFLLLFQ